MQETGRQGAPSLFAPLPRTGLCTKPCSGLCTEPCSGPRARLCSGPHGSHLLPHTVIAAPPLAPLPCRPHHCCSLRAVRIFVRRPSPACRIPDLAVPPCLPLPGGFFPNFRCVFHTRHATNVCTFVQHTENKYVTIKAEKDNLLTESKLHFSGFPAGRHGATDP